MLSSVFFRTCVLVTWHATTPPCVYSPRLELTLVTQNAAFFLCVLNVAVSIYLRLVSCGSQGVSRISRVILKINLFIDGYQSQRELHFHKTPLARVIIIRRGQRRVQ